MSMQRHWSALDEAQLVSLAGAFAGIIDSGGVIHLEGDLGAGKTTFARALLRVLGVGERIKSPTYSLIESYEAAAMRIHHLDLYRIADPDELEWLGLGDLAEGSSLLLVEWPKRGQGALPAADLVLQLSHAGEARDLDALACTPRAIDWLARLPA